MTNSSAAGQGEVPQRSEEQRPPVSRPAPSTPPASAATPSQPATAPEDPAQFALDAETIQHLHTTLRALPRPLLESLTRAFRKRFQVPETAVTIADRISQKCHHDWIEAFLVQQQSTTTD